MSGNTDWNPAEVTGDPRKAQMERPASANQGDFEALTRARRQALLMEVDAIERFLGISPRTAELRSKAK